MNYSPGQLDKSNPQKDGACQPVKNSDKSKSVFIAYLEKPGERREGVPSVDGISVGVGSGDISR